MLCVVCYALICFVLIGFGGLACLVAGFDLLCLVFGGLPLLRVLVWVCGLALPFAYLVLVLIVFLRFMVGLSLPISLVGLLVFACYRFARFWLVCCVSDVACFCWVLIFVMVEFDCALRYFGGFGLWF